MMLVPGISFTVPGRPVPKQRPRMGRGGHMYTPRRTRDYEQLVGQCALAAGAKRNREPVAVRLEIHVRPSLRLDVDNVAKSVLDGCNGVVWDDDARVRCLEVVRVDDDDERVVVTITPAEAVAREA